MLRTSSVAAATIVSECSPVRGSARLGSARACSRDEAAVSVRAGALAVSDLEAYRDGVVWQKTVGSPSGNLTGFVHVRDELWPDDSSPSPDGGRPQPPGDDRCRHGDERDDRAEPDERRLQPERADQQPRKHRRAPRSKRTRRCSTPP